MANNDYGQFIKEVQLALNGSLAFIGSSANVMDKFIPTAYHGSSYGVVLCPTTFPPDERGIGRWYRRYYAVEVNCVIKSGMPEGTRIMGGGTFTAGIGSFVDTVRNCLRNNRLMGAGTYFLDSYQGAGLSKTEPILRMANDSEGAKFTFNGRKLFNDT